MTEPAAKGQFPHILRVIVCLMTFGFVFPHALMENIDAARLLAKDELRKDTTREP
jgi:hypothetical protein